MFVIAQTIVLLVISNVFMTLAWYGHLGSDNRSSWVVLDFIADLKNRPMYIAILVSWAIAFVEYVFQVPANRIGHEAMNRSQLKILQEVISLTVFVLMAIFYWRERIGWNYLWAGICIVAAVAFVFQSPPSEVPIQTAETTQSR